MARTADDSWDIATSVGATAVLVAAARAAETARADPLITDEFAERLISTPALAEVRAGIEMMLSTSAGAQGRQIVTYHAVRTHFFDAFFATLPAAIHQVVILAAGLDSRAYRLNWPECTAVYEVDVPAVLAYKSATLTAQGAVPRVARREVAVDLRQDWPKALQDHGFDPEIPTAWLIEGLLPFLTGAAQQVLFDRVARLSAPGSRAAIEAFPLDHGVRESGRQFRELSQQRDIGFDPGDVWYGDDGRPDTAEWFTRHGWSTTVVNSRDETERLGRAVGPTPPGEKPFYGLLLVAGKPES